MGRVWALATIVLVLSLAAGTPSATAAQPPNPDPFSFEACASKTKPGCAKALAAAGEQTARLRQQIKQSSDPGRFGAVLKAADALDESIAKTKAQACGDLAPGPSPDPMAAAPCLGLTGDLVLDWGSLASAVDSANSGK